MCVCLWNVNILRNTFVACTGFFFVINTFEFGATVPLTRAFRCLLKKRLSARFGNPSKSDFEAPWVSLDCSARFQNVCKCSWGFYDLAQYSPLWCVRLWLRVCENYVRIPGDLGYNSLWNLQVQDCAYAWCPLSLEISFEIFVTLEVLLMVLRLRVRHYFVCWHTSPEEAHQRCVVVAVESDWVRK